MDRVSKVVRCSISLSSGIPLDDISETTDIAATGMCSLDRMEMLLEIEDELDVLIPWKRGAKVETVGQLEDRVRETMRSAGRDLSS